MTDKQDLIDDANKLVNRMIEGVEPLTSQEKIRCRALLLFALGTLHVLSSEEVTQILNAVLQFLAKPGVVITPAP